MPHSSGSGKRSRWVSAERLASASMSRTASTEASRQGGASVVTHSVPIRTPEPAERRDVRSRGARPQTRVVERETAEWRGEGGPPGRSGGSRGVGGRLPAAQPPAGFACALARAISAAAAFGVRCAGFGRS